MAYTGGAVPYSRDIGETINNGGTVTLTCSYGEVADAMPQASASTVRVHPGMKWATESFPNSKGCTAYHLWNAAGDKIGSLWVKQDSARSNESTLWFDGAVDEAVKVEYVVVVKEIWEHLHLNGMPLAAAATRGEELGVNATPSRRCALKLTFTIKATPGGFHNFLGDFTNGATIQQIEEGFGEWPKIPVDDGQQVMLQYVPWPPARAFGSFVHEHGNLQGRIDALFFPGHTGPDEAAGPDVHEPLEATSPDVRVAIGFRLVPAGELLRVTMACYEPVAEDCFIELVREIRQTWPESRERIDAYLTGLDGEAATGDGKTERQSQGATGGGETRDAATVATAATEKPEGERRGINGGTMERVKEALKSIQRGEPQTRACKNAHIDPRTYEKWVMNITCPEDEEDE